MKFTWEQKVNDFCTVCVCLIIFLVMGFLFGIGSWLAWKLVGLIN